MTINCEFFEVGDWDERNNCAIHAVCTKESPEWPNCLKCQSRVEYNEPTQEENDTMFFVINVAKMTREDFSEAMFILSYYHVNTSLYSDGEHAVSTYMVVESNKDDKDDLRLAEMAFQMNFHQDHTPLACSHCEGEDGCGHLMFTKKINPAF